MTGGAGRCRRRSRSTGGAGGAGGAGGGGEVGQAGAAGQQGEKGGGYHARVSGGLRGERDFVLLSAKVCSGVLGQEGARTRWR